MKLTNLAEKQQEHLLFYFQYVNEAIDINILKRYGFEGIDGKRCAPLNPCACVQNLREDGWIIQTKREIPSQYIFKGHFEDFDITSQDAFIEMGWVYPSERKKRNHLPKPIH